jgi:succinate-semialdehyde dehydrogenase/glutarate-semialdehyde dehydrogenase
MALLAINPANGETLATYEEMTASEVQGIVGKVHEAFLGWRLMSFHSRAAVQGPGVCPSDG